jgi:hypothetical protein
MEPRLRDRYAILVQQHLHAAGPLTSGLGPPPAECSTLSAVQAAWRFFNNDRVTLPALIEPLHQVATQWRQAHDGWALVVHDWSALSYATHRSKTDRARLGPMHSRGYDLTTLLLVDGQDGSPVAPLELSLRAAEAVCSTRTPAPSVKSNHLIEVLPAMQAVRERGLGERLVHVIDREADSLGYYRQWHSDCHRFLVRSDSERFVRWQGEEMRLAELNGRLQGNDQFCRSREVNYRGQQAVQHVAETEVVLDRPAWRTRKGRGKRRINECWPGEPITLRLIVSRVCDERGETVAVWYLLTNLPPEVSAAEVALWYYWRWRIESFFKLLKSAGQEAEQWQQETAGAIAKRLLVAAMACVLVWKLERTKTPEATRFCDLLVRFSGRQMKRTKPHTAPALLAGLYVYLAMLEALEDHSVEELRAMRRHLVLNQPDSG